MDLQPAFETLITLVYDVTFLPFAVGFTVAATALLKRVIPAQQVRSSAIALAVQVLVWVLWISAKQIGYADQFETVITALTTMLSGLTMLVATAAGSETGYRWLREREVPFFGESREVGE